MPLTILLIEDTKVHRDAAIEQLKEHKLIVCENFKEFQQVATKIQRFDKYQELLKKPEQERLPYEKLLMEGYKDFPFNGKLDVLLTDCLMPPEADAYVFQEGHSNDHIAFGPLALLWAIQQNIPKAGLLMLNNHHDHPIAAGLDLLGGRSKKIRKYGNTEILIATDDFYSDDPNGEFISSKLQGQKGNYVKEWGLFLNKLMDI